MSNAMTLVSRTATIAVATITLTGCLATAPTVGGGSVSPITGAAGGGTAVGANESLERCDKTLCVLRIEKETAGPWYSFYGPRVGSTAPC
jgi:hypothetical protein